ncbi:MAG: MgtC/SapB family protein [Hydrogenophilales bacterium]|nr:MgtC/SapB family protein [Hydrogenophilales bacterium]
MNIPVLNVPDIGYLFTFATSLALGLLIGLERERNPNAKAGLRTFALTALLGTLAALLADKTGSPWFLAAALVGVAGFILTAYLGGDHDTEPGTTTQVALLVCFGLGAMVWYGEQTLAIMLAIVTTALLYFKTELEGISKSLTRRDLVSMLQFAVVTFIVLPVLPNQNYGPYNTLNPYQIWLMVVLISGVSLAGYVALRIFGLRYGAVLLGLLGGLVSSTATTLVYAKHSRTDAEMRKLAVTVILLANLVVMLRLSVLAAIIAPSLLARLLPVLGAGFALGLAVTLYQWRRQHAHGALLMPDMKNPTELRAALSFGLLYAIVLLAASWLSDYAGEKGLYAVALVSGLTDVDPITLSTLRLLDLGQVVQVQAVTAIMLALLANLIFKLGLVFSIGGRALGVACIPTLAAVAVGSGVALYLF